MKNKNINYMDIAKAIGIMLVVLGHTNFPYRNVIYLFHMPLFFFISGYFFKYEEFSNPIRFFIKKMKSLYIPFVKFGLMFILLHNLFFNINFYSEIVNFGGRYVHQYNLNDFMKHIYDIVKFKSSEQLIGAIWFIQVLFFTEVIFCVMGFILKSIKVNAVNSGMGIFSMLSFICGIVLSKFNIKITYQINIVVVAIFIFYLGVLFKRYEDKVKFNIKNSIILFAALIICSWYSTVEMSANSYSNPILFIVGFVSGIYLILYVSKLLDNSKFKFKNVLLYIGKNTIVIMLLHFSCFKVINLLAAIIYNLPKSSIAQFPTIPNLFGIWWLLYLIAGVAFPTIIAFLFNIVKKNCTKNGYIHKVNIEI